MKYRSTRANLNYQLDAPTAIIQGLSPEGGLFVPVAFPHPIFDLNKFKNLSYQEMAKKILATFFDDFSNEQLAGIVDQSYDKQWDTQEIVKIVNHADNFYLELFHGPTLAFKDIALQVLPRLMNKAINIKQVDSDIIILTATSGDTGGAAMSGFKGQDHTHVIVFYPYGGVSPVQLRQMLALKGNNLTAIAIKGNFDDAQSNVKKIFNNHELVEKLNLNKLQFSSANSMNIGRLIPQIVYYFYSYVQLFKKCNIRSGQKINFSVPTGNFGDILAGYYAKKLGLPINKLICASDQNNVLTDFFKTGTYDRRRKFYLTNSPAMDILVSSNLERLLFDLYDEDSNELAKLMNNLNANGKYTVNSTVKEKLDQIFAAGFASEKEVEDEIKRIYDKDRYTIDPHTAVASFVTKQYQKNTHDKTPTIIVSTASPYKFPETVFHALTEKEVKQKGIPAIQELNNYLKEDFQGNVHNLIQNGNYQEQIIEANQMKDTLLNILNL
ncbi:threonine synthase [Lactobacillus hominis]|uniref:Threonine synthase n=1 Tax=Lactobacillus hominis DSM 23910 = CRBIP 24.179 TaxID=1423758 RepID=I7L911_9LACO|nr:threonine synthase [Lactobacillus hominis]KRM85961.1 threonine synthase [Lactobacillus hominis DSM 23910 = CRBIP 24.179]MCT3348809.1 threonine synthase [Lactobacillus hominis]CCI81084.1 Threonine synthase [Lactobacillus hominis DSM 23910 = CRBIP 24.179]